MNKNRILGLSAVLSAGLASICCVGPLLVTALGLGSLRLAAGLARYRSYFLALTGAILAAGFYFAYRKRPVQCADGSCRVASASRVAKAGLWLATALAAAVATFPNWSALALRKSGPVIPAGAQVLTLNVSGMDCAACAPGIEKSVERVPGVLSARVDFEHARATVVTDGKADPRAVVASVKSAGYQATVVGLGANGKPRS